MTKNYWATGGIARLQPATGDLAASLAVAEQGRRSLPLSVTFSISVTVNAQVEGWGMTAMASEIRKSGIDIVGDMVAWGAHFCLFYETKEDLLDTLISYCKSGLESGEYCLWIVAEPLTIEEATDALKDAMPDLGRYLADSRLEIASARDWFLQGGTFDGERVTRGWHEKLAVVSARGYPGMRVTGDTTWLAKKDWGHFCDYEDGLNEVIGNRRLAVLCTYPLAACGAPQILDVVRTHQFVLARRQGNWDVVETAALKRAKADIKLINEGLEQRVEERTNQLMLASEALREAQAELAHINRVTTMGELTASIAHEVMQPIASARNNARAAQNFLDMERPDLGEAREALACVVGDADRAADIIDRIREHMKKAPPRKECFDLNAAISEVIALTRSATSGKTVSVQTRFANGLRLVEGDRVQLQQVILNLIRNAVEAIEASDMGQRELLISTQQDGTEIVVSVRDTGPGVDPKQLERVFEAFYTTKPSGTGMGLSICRSIIDAHGGRLWVEPNEPRGSVFQFTLPGAEARS